MKTQLVMNLINRTIPNEYYVQDNAQANNNKLS